MTKSLHAGPFTVIFENGFLRYFRHGEHEIVRMIYFALRDENWGTLPMRIENYKEEIQVNGFSIYYEAINHNSGKDILRWHVAIQGTYNRISFSLHGRCLHEFKRNRAGLCLLHPIKETIGQSVLITQPDGREVSGVFPTMVDPIAPFENIAKISWQLPSGKWARVSFVGDVFEMEDQRNWTDASFKTFCTPLHLPRPVTLRVHDEIRQEIILEVDEHPAIPELPYKPITITQSGQRNSIPALGFGAAQCETLPDAESVSNLKKLSPAFLRVEANLNKPDWRQQLDQGMKEAALLQTSVALVATLPPDYREHWTELRNALPRELNLNSLSLFSTTRATPQSLLDELLPIIQKEFAKLPVLAGSNIHFVDVNRYRFDFSQVDGLAFPINPQVHAFDDLSLIENVAAQHDVVVSARHFSHQKIHVGPITLRPRFNPEAIQEEAIDATQLPYAVDSRQSESFAALWTLGSFKYLAESGLEAVTYYETHGMAGLLLSHHDKPHSKFGQQHKGVFPVYKVFEMLREFAGGEVVHTMSSNPLAVSSLLLKKYSNQQLVLVNFSNQKQDVVYENKEFSLTPASWSIHSI